MARKTEAELLSAIEDLENLLDSGAQTVTQDGHTTVFDLEAAASRLRDLRRELSILRGKPARRPLFNRINLS